MSTDVIVIGGGLAGLTCALELTMRGKRVELFEAEHVVGGRTASWDEDGMQVESGFHRFIGYYRELPRILKKAGVEVDEIIKWEEQIDVIKKQNLKESKENIIGTFGISPVQGPVKMLMGFLGNNSLIPPKQKLSLIPFFVKGFYDYMNNPKELDSYSVYDYARKQGVDENAIRYMLIPLSTGIYFLPVEEYSAYVFFGMFAPAIPRFYTMRIGAFLGGMTEVMARPLADSIEKRGGKIHTRTKVEQLIVENDKVNGVIVGNKEVRAQNVVLATSLGAAKRIIKRSFEKPPAFFSDMLNLPTMSAVTIQIETEKPLMPYDRTTFGPMTCLASFAEQSRTTFKRKTDGRLSIILTPPERFLPLNKEEIFKVVCEDADALGIPLKENVKEYRVVSHPEDFHSLSPGHNWMRPSQRTTVKGLTLAGDYTEQPYFSTMEGAVVSGVKAAKGI
jgi:15-cis-phytoene desaturase